MSGATSALRSHRCGRSGSTRWRRHYCGATGNKETTGSSRGASSASSSFAFSGGSHGGDAFFGSADSDGFRASGALADSDGSRGSDGLDALAEGRACFDAFGSSGFFDSFADALQANELIGPPNLRTLFPKPLHSKASGKATGGLRADDNRRPARR